MYFVYGRKLSALDITESICCCDFSCSLLSIAADKEHIVAFSSLAGVRMFDTTNRRVGISATHRVEKCRLSVRLDLHLAGLFPVQVTQKSPCQQRFDCTRHSGWQQYSPIVSDSIKTFSVSLCGYSELVGSRIFVLEVLI